MRIAAINKCDFVKIKWRRTNNYLYTERSMSKYDDTTTYKAKLLSMDNDAVRMEYMGNICTTDSNESARPRMNFNNAVRHSTNCIEQERAKPNDKVLDDFCHKSRFV